MPEVVVVLGQADLAVLSPLEAGVDLARLPLLAQFLPVLEVEAELAVEEVSVEAVHKSFSAAMAGNLPSAGTPRYSPAPRSGRKAKRHP